MGHIIKKSLKEDLLIGLSTYLFWTVPVFFSYAGNLTLLFQALVTVYWILTWFLFLNIFLHSLAIPFIKKRKHRWAWIVGLCIFVLVMITFGSYCWNSIGNGLFTLIKGSDVNLVEKILRNALMGFFSLAYFAGIRFTLAYYRIQIINRELLIEKQHSELNFLRSQTNPHFLFNTLNNIYSLTRDKSDMAPETVLRLSHILRYMLYETQTALVKVESEIKILKDYIELEKMRYDNTLRVSFDSAIDTPECLIPPLLLIPIVENAFKHGSSETISNPYVNISIKINSEELLFVVENSVDESFIPEKTDGIGLKNLRRQLELLFKDYSLQIENRKTSFLVSLYINLQSHADN